MYSLPHPISTHPTIPLSLSMTNSFYTHINNFLKRVNLLTKHKIFTKHKPKRPDLTWLAAMDPSTQLKQVFKFFDINGDGKISPLELKTVLLRFDHHDKSTAAFEAQEILRELDFNGDGFIDLDEFMEVVQEHDDDDGVRDAFEVFDADKNGLISAKELQRVLVSLGFSNSGIGKCRKMIKGVDRSGDGFVDFDEFKSMMTAGINQV